MMKNCDICNNVLKQSMPVVYDPITQEHFSIWTCSHCSLGHTTPKPDIMECYYPSAYYGGRHGITGRFCIRRRLRILQRENREKTGALTLLDIGCGDGSFLLAAKEKGWNVCGLERFPDTARAMGLTIAENPDELLDQRFDCITLWHSLEHIAEPNHMFSVVASLLKPNGVVIIAVPDNNGWQAKLFNRYWLHLDVPRHLYHFTHLCITEGFTRAGLVVTHTMHQEFEYDLLGWSQSLLNSAFPTSNTFFNWLTKKPVLCGKLEAITQVITGFSLTIFFVPFVWISSLCSRGGTLIVSGGHK